MTIRPRAPRVTAVAAAVGLLTLAACADDAPQTGSDSTRSSPLAEFLPDDDPSDDTGRLLQARTENLIARCMADAGFEYVPRETTTDLVPHGGQDEDRGNTEEWVSQHGYGMQPDEEDPGNDDQEDDDSGADPNADYVASLSETARAAYHEALDGPDLWSQMTDEEKDNFEWRWEDQGCTGWAGQQVASDSAVEEHKPLLDALAEMYDDLRDAPELKTLSAEWSSCMADAGYTGYATPDDAREAVMKSYGALWDQHDASDSPDSERQEPSAEERRAVKEEEIETALADFRCKESVDWTEREQKVAFAIEEQFVKDHRAELEAYKASRSNDAAAT